MFLSSNIISVNGDVNPIRDIEIINLELIFADLDVVEKRIGKVQRKAETNKDKDAMAEMAVLKKLYDALYDMLPREIVDKKMEFGEIEVAPLAYMRGRTLSHAAVILDEAQNTTPMQMKMFLTRLGEGSRMIINGDLTQTDLPRGTTSGLVEAVRILKNVPESAFVSFTDKDVVRHGLVSKIVKAYEKANAVHVEMDK